MSYTPTYSDGYNDGLKDAAAPNAHPHTGGNPDTQLLSAHLQAAYAEVLTALLPNLGPAAYDAAWYRVAERAKELRA